MLPLKINLKNKPKSENYFAIYLCHAMLCITLLSIGACNCRNPQITVAHAIETVNIRLTTDKTELHGTGIFILHLQHEGSITSSLNDYHLQLTLQEEGGIGTQLRYQDASNNSYNASSLQEKLTYFTTKKDLSPEDAAFDIPITIQPGLGVSKIIITAMISSKDNVQSVTIAWKAFAVTDDMVQAANGYNDLSRLLQHLQTGLAITADEKNKAIRQAAELGNEEIFNVLLTVPGIDVNAKNKHGKTPLHIAAREQRSNIVQLLLQTKGIKVIERSDDGKTPLDLANRTQHVGIINLLLKAERTP